MADTPKGNRVLFLHLSDIHFSKSRGEEVYDVDTNVRHELRLDCETTAGKIGAVDGVLVTGDIAFSGKPEQYANAHVWLGEICKAIKCSPENVWMIPGNHDVNRKVYDDDPVALATHEQLRAANRDDFDRRIGQFLKGEQGRAVVYSSLKNYRDFAKKFECIPEQKSLHWEEDFVLNDGSLLRLRGLNSAVVCDASDDDEGKRLMLGQVQCTSPRDPGVTYMFLTHHPPEWVKDRDAVEDDFRARARIQLMGHKHTQRMGIIYGNLRLAAGAVNPDRREPNWLPRYNFLALSVADQNGHRKLKVDVYPRVWNVAEQTFSPERDKEGSECHTFTLDLPAWTRPAGSPDAATVAIVPTSYVASGSSQRETGETSVNEDLKGRPVNLHRRLTYNFLSLPHHVRVAIGSKLGLIRDEDEGVDDAELFRRIFQRAQTEGHLEELAKEIDIRKAK